jgi:peptidoglycan hydrolase CwlO-like protein
MRHKTLIETNEDLMTMLQSFQDEIEGQQKGLQELIKEKNDEILVYNSTLGTHQKRLDKMKQHCANLEQKQEERDRTGKERVCLVCVY